MTSCEIQPGMEELAEAAVEASGALIADALREALDSAPNTSEGLVRFLDFAWGAPPREACAGCPIAPTALEAPIISPRRRALAARCFDEQQRLTAALLARISPTTGYLEVLPSLLLIGAGMGAAFVGITSSAVAGVRREDTGVASALLNASQQIEGSLGLAVLTAVSTARFDAVSPVVPTPAAVASAYTSSWAYAFVVGALLLFAAAAIVGFLLRPHPDQPPAEEVTTTAVGPDATSPSPASVVRVMACSGCHA